MAEYAKNHNMLVAMANHNQSATIQSSSRWIPVGKSSIWSNTGLLAKASETENAIIIAENLSDGWHGLVVKI